MLDTTDEFDAPADEDTPPTDTPEAVADPPPVDPEPLPADDADESEPRSKREAKYRVQLRETQAERDQLAARVESLQRGEVERLAAKVIKQPSALWAAQTSLADLLADDGTVDERKVTDAASAAQKTLGLAATRPAGYVAREGTSLRKSSSAGNSWEAAFR